MTEAAPTEANQLTPKEHARKIFKLASKEYSASATTQGARIAIYCQTNHLAPEQLKISLITNDTEIEKMQEAAIANHLVAKKGPTFINVNHTKSIIASAFDWANSLMNVDEADIQTLFTEYQESFPTGKPQEERDIWEATQEQRARQIAEAAKKRSPHKPNSG